MPSQSTQDPPSDTVSTLFNQAQQSAWLTRLLAKTKALQVLQELFARECPLELMGRCQVLGIEKRCLTIAVDNASSATQLQFRSRELLIALRQYTEFADVKKIAVRIAK